MHMIQTIATALVVGAVCTFVAYYAGARAEQLRALTMRRDVYRLGRWCAQLRDANHELLAENASLRAGEEPLSPREMVALSEIEASEWEAGR